MKGQLFAALISRRDFMVGQGPGALAKSIVNVDMTNVPEEHRAELEHLQKEARKMPTPEEMLKELCEESDSIYQDWSVPFFQAVRDHLGVEDEDLYRTYASAFIGRLGTEYEDIPFSDYVQALRG